MTNKRPVSMDIQVGQSIRAHRLVAGMSQSDLADKLGVSFQQVQKYEKGVNRVGAGRLLKIAGVFDVPINVLFESHVDTSLSGAKANRAPVNLISDKSTLKLLTSYTDITDRAVRRGVAHLVDIIAKASRRHKSRKGGASRAP